jgi:hypothetical protein
MTLFRCPHCGGHSDLDHEIINRLDRIERLVHTEGIIMTEIDDRLAAVATQFDDLTTDLGRELADLTNAVAGNLTAEQRAEFDALAQKMTDAKLAIDTADPPPAPPV